MLKKFSARALLGIALSVALLPLASGGPSEKELEKASVHGKYGDLIQVLPCAKDRASYGKFKDYGHWGGGAWCGQTGEAGYWVWVAPKWYVWRNQVN